MAVGVSKGSLKFQATEREASKQQMTERQEKTQSWCERGSALFWKVRYTHWGRHLAKPKTEYNFSSFIEKLETLLSTKDSILKHTTLVRGRQSQRSTRKFKWSKNFGSYFQPWAVECRFVFEPTRNRTTPSWAYLLCWGCMDTFPGNANGHRCC